MNNCRLSDMEFRWFVDGAGDRAQFGRVSVPGCSVSRPVSPRQKQTGPVRNLRLRKKADRCPSCSYPGDSFII